MSIILDPGTNKIRHAFSAASDGERIEVNPGWWLPRNIQAGPRLALQQQALPETKMTDRSV